jgi:glycosyltransferase involved in cell wall biosynthesis
MMTTLSEKPANRTVSVIIPSYNSIKTIGKTLEGLKSQTAISSVREILIVDSSDDEISHEFLLEQENELIRVHRSGYRVMPAIQRNIGAGMATGDVLCFIDSDAYPKEDWIEQLLKVSKTGILAGGGSYAVPDFQKKLRIAYAQYFLEFSQYIGFGKKRTIAIVASCNLFCDRELFQRVGGFPEVRASEDSMFCLKVNRVEKLIFIPDATVYHIFREDRKHFLTNQLMLGKYIYYFRKKSYHSFYYKGIMPYLLFPLFITFKLCRIFIRVSRTNFYNFKMFFKSFPLLLEGTYWWGKGFLSGIKNFNE